MVEPQKQATSGLQKKTRVPPMQITFVSKQNGRTVPSESERSIEKLARVPSMQTVVFVVHQLHGTQQMRRLRQQNGEHSVHTNDCFAQRIGHTVHSERETCLEENYESSVHVGCAVCS